LSGAGAPVALAQRVPAETAFSPELHCLATARELTRLPGDGGGTTTDASRKTTGPKLRARIWNGPISRVPMMFFTIVRALMLLLAILLLVTARRCSCLVPTLFDGNVRA
jgi:hypothetical protein